MFFSKINPSRRFFLLAFLCLAFAGLTSCETSDKQAGKETGDEVEVSTSDSEDQLVCTTMCTSVLNGQGGEDPYVNDIEWVINLEALTAEGEAGSPVSELLDSVSWQIEAGTNGGWYIPSLKSEAQDTPPNDCEPTQVTLGTAVFSEDSARATIDAFLTIDDEGCTNNVMETGGILVVVVAEGMPDQAGEVNLYNVQGWKDGHPVEMSIEKRE